METLNSPDTSSQPDSEDFISNLIVQGGLRQKIEDALNTVSRKRPKNQCRINILFDNKPWFPHVALLTGTGNKPPVFLADVSKKSDIALDELGPNDSFDLIVDSASIDIESVAKEIPELLSTHYPLVADLPIAVYESLEDFKMKRPAIVCNPRQVVSHAEPAIAP